MGLIRFLLEKIHLFAVKKQNGLMRGDEKFVIVSVVLFNPDRVSLLQMLVMWFVKSYDTASVECRGKRR